MHDDPPAVSDSSNASAEYGRLNSRNIDVVAFGDLRFHTWYGNSAYFLSTNDEKLGIDQVAGNGRRRGHSPANPGIWLDVLYVCDTCFKYTASAEDMSGHTLICSLQKRFPSLGRLVYSDPKSSLYIKRVRGFRHPLFCQNLALFGKLFLDDKSVFYNLDAFDFYVVYGAPKAGNDGSSNSGINPYLKPMGFFSKEVNSWEPDNNLACICVFPPFQRLGIGSLLLEFSYALARVTPGQMWSGPEFPLSPFGKALYLQFWSRQLSFIILNDLRDRDYIYLKDLADLSGFRKEDILMTLEYMGVLQKGTKVTMKVILLVSNTTEWCRKNGVSVNVLRSMLDENCLLL